jgi:acyl carrier protein
MPGTAGGISAGPGTWGTNEFVEPYVRRLVAEHLGVGAEELVSHVSLRDDLAADSLDLVELAVALEGEFAIVVPERVVADVHTYSDLVRATAALIRARCAETGAAQPPARVRIATHTAGGSFARSANSQGSASVALSRA